MSDVEADVIAAATERADALSVGDRDRLREMLHPRFVWTSHRGDAFDRDAYLDSNTGGRNTWHHQQLDDIEVHVVGNAAVLRCLVTDDVTTPDGRRLFRMPMTQMWVWDRGRWRCLAGHAGPRINPGP